MRLLFRTRLIRCRQRLLGLLALGLLSSQLICAVHAADLDAHVDDNPCQICKLLEPIGDAPATTIANSVQFEASKPLPTISLTAVVLRTRGIQPPTRAPPR